MILEYNIREGQYSMIEHYNGLVQSYSEILKYNNTFK